VSPSRKRRAVKELEASFDVSERRACEVIDQARSTQRYQPELTTDEPRLIKRMRELVRQFPRYGYRRIWAKLKQEGWVVNVKRIYRLWRKEGLKVRQKKRKRKSLGSSENACIRKPSERKDDVWAWDFVFDRTESGTTLKWLSIVDEFTRECLALNVDRSITSADVIDTLAELFAVRGVPQRIRSDNGSEFIANAIQLWLTRLNVRTLYIAPGSPWENGYAESFHSRLRDEFLGLEVFESLSAARQLSACWMRDYNESRPHSSLGYRTPAEFGGMPTSARARQTGSAPLPSASASTSPGSAGRGDSEGERGSPKVLEKLTKFI